MLDRRAILVELLRSYRDVLEDSWGRGIGGDGDGVMCMSPEWREGSYSELTETLQFMRACRLRLYWAVSERYIRAVRIPKYVRRSSQGVWFERVPIPNGKTCTCTSGNGPAKRCAWHLKYPDLPLRRDIGETLNEEVKGPKRQSISEHRRMVEFWQPVFEGDVALGLRFLDEHFCGEPRLPKALQERLAA